METANFFDNFEQPEFWNGTFLFDNYTFNNSLHLRFDLYSLKDDTPFVFKVILIVLYCISFATAIFGNIVVFFSIISSTKRSKMDFFLVNFTVTDTLMTTAWILFTCVGHIIFQYWPMDASMCKILRYLQNFLVLQRSFSMVILSYEQHFVISKPMKTITRKSYCVKLTAFISWTLAALLAIPSFVLSRFVRLPLGPSSPGLCLEPWSESSGKLVYNIVIMLLQFTIPLVIMAVLYFHIGIIIWTNKIPGEMDILRDHRINKSKTKSVKLLFSLVGCFAVTWMPLYILTMIGEMNPHIYERTDIYMLWLVFQLLAYSNSSINSVLFLTLNTKFKTCVSQLIAHITCGKLESFKKKAERKYSPVTVTVNTKIEMEECCL